MNGIDTYRTWAEIDLDALAYNMRQIRQATDKNAKILAVIKANAYGHGDIECYNILRKNGADCFGVATVQEAVRLRTHGATEPILILGYVPAQAAETLLKYDVMPTVFDAETAASFSKAAQASGKSLRVHIKVDTGMGRIGFSALPEMVDATITEIERVSKLPGIVFDGIFSHFSCSDTDADYTNLQYERFMFLCEALKKKNIDIGTRHICNSAGVVLEKEKHLDMVRPGIILYGLHPDESTKGKIDLKPVMQWYAHITHIKTVEAGSTISYGNTYVAPKQMRIGTVCVGYADGYARTMSGKVEMLAQDTQVQQIGRICMDQCMIDLTNVHTIRVGDQVTLMGDSISADELAALQGTINYEVVCAIGARVERIYKEMQG